VSVARVDGAVRETGNTLRLHGLIFCNTAAKAMLDRDLSRQFVVESQSRAIDSCNDVAELRRIAKTLLTAWHLQSDMTRYFGAQAMGITPQNP